MDSYFQSKKKKVVVANPAFGIRLNANYLGITQWNLVKNNT